jgi:excisionase family DNA binding protein
MAERMTTAQAAARLQRSLKTVTRWAESGRLPALDKFPGKRGGYLFAADDVENLAAELAAELEAEAGRIRAAAS